MTAALARLREAVASADPAALVLARELGDDALAVLGAYGPEASEEQRLYALYAARAVDSPGARRWAAGHVLDASERVRMAAYAALEGRTPVPFARALVESYSWREATFERLAMSALLAAAGAPLELDALRSLCEVERDAVCLRNLWLARANQGEPEAIDRCASSLRDPELTSRALGLSDMQRARGAWVLPIVLEYLDDRRALTSTEDAPLPLAPRELRVCDFAVDCARRLLGERLEGVTPGLANFTERELATARARVRARIAAEGPAP